MNKIDKNFWTENNKNFTDSYFYSKSLNLILYDDSSFSLSIMSDCFINYDTFI